MNTESNQIVSAGSEHTQDQALPDNRLRQLSFIEQNIEGTWRLDLKQPIPLDLPPLEQIELLYRYGYFGEANQALAAQYGYDTPAEIIGCRLEEFIPRELPTSIPRLTQVVLSKFCVNSWESIEQDRFGNRKVFLNNMIGEIVDGKLQRIWGTAKDITRQKQLEEETRLHTAMFEQVPDGCVIVEAESEKVVYLNPAFTRISGYTASDIGDNKLSILQGSDTNPDTVAEVRAAIAQEQPFLGEILNYKKDGTPFWNLMRISPIRDTDGVVTHYVGILSDVTEHKQIDENLREQSNQLAHVARVAAMGELTAALAHELNQPLAAILSNAQAAQRFLDQEDPDIDEVREILKDVVADDRRASEVIHRIRRMIKRDNSQFERLDINRVIEDVHAFMSNDVAIKHVTLSTQLTPDLPALHGDPVQLQQVILNLIMNACQAIQDMDADKRRISVATRNQDDHAIEITVTDSGHGIDDKLLDKIFQPFFTTKVEGMGMGLAVNRTIVEAHGGRLWAENNPDSGAVFRITLPASP